MSIYENLRRPSLGNLLMSTANGMPDVTPNPFHVPRQREFVPGNKPPQDGSIPLGQVLSQAAGMAPAAVAPVSTPAPLMPTATPPSAPVGVASELWKPSKGQMIAGIFADMLAGATGKAPTFAPMVEQRRQEDAQERVRAADWGRQDRNRAENRHWQVEDREYLANRPETFTSGRDRVRYDPSTGESTVVYDGQEDFETYAGSMGDPDTPEYRAAMQDYVLRGNGPTAFKYDQGLEAVRNANRVALRATPTYAQANPRPRSNGGGRGRAPTVAGTVAPIIAKVAAGQSLTAGEQKAWDMYRSGRGGSRGGGSRAAPAPATEATGNLPRPKSREDYQKLPKGAKFVDPNGAVRVK